MEDSLDEETDGVVYLLAPDESRIEHFNGTTISLYAALPRIEDDARTDLIDFFYSNDTYLSHKVDNQALIMLNNLSCIQRLIKEVRAENPSFTRIDNHMTLFNDILYLPKQSNARIIRQSAAFILVGLEPDITIDDSIRSSRVPIIISGDAKGSIRRKTQEGRFLRVIFASQFATRTTVASGYASPIH